MKKLLLFLFFLPLGLHAQEYKDFDEKEIIIKPTRVISSSYEKTNEIQPLFSVWKASDRSLRHCEVYAQVLDCRKSNVSGSEGRLVIRPLYILQDGKKICVHGDIHIRGVNRTNLKMALCFLPFMWFVPGGGAKTGSDEFKVYLD